MVLAPPPPKKKENSRRPFTVTSTSDGNTAPRIGQHLAVLKRRSDTACTLIRAELEQFHRCRIHDVHRSLQALVEDSVAYHRRAADVWQELLPKVGDSAIREPPLP